MKKLACLLVAGLLVGACATRQVGERAAIPVPAGLDAAQVEGAVRTALQRAKWQHRWKRGEWRVESADTGRIVAGMQWDVHYLQVAIGYTAQQVTTEILASRNLREEDGRIHRHALAQQKRLEQEIAEQLGYLVAPVAPGMAPPATEPRPAS